MSKCFYLGLRQAQTDNSQTIFDHITLNLKLLLFTYLVNYTQRVYLILYEVLEANFFL